MNIHKEVTKILFPDGFHSIENHGLWKLKTQLSNTEWDNVKEYFNYYSKNDKNIRNSKYGGWMTTKPVEVLLKLKEKPIQQKLC